MSKIAFRTFLNALIQCIPEFFGAPPCGERNELKLIGVNSLMRNEDLGSLLLSFTMFFVSACYKSKML